MQDLFAKAQMVCQKNLELVVEHNSANKAVLIYDTMSPLADLLGRGYASCLSNHQVIQYDPHRTEDCLHVLHSLGEGDLAILVQSSSFRLSEFRIRVELFARGVKVIEHPHLDPMHGDEIEYYLDSLDYEPNYDRVIGSKLKAIIDVAQSARICGAGAELIVDGPFEDAKLNVGDYSGRKNIGGQFPIGEIFTEAKILEDMNGEVVLFAYGDANFRVQFPLIPIVLRIRAGRVVATENSNEEFNAILDEIRAYEGDVWVREIGFGLNRAFTRKRVVAGIGSYERFCGVHLSLGAKHHIYPKSQFNKRKTKYHVDVFVDAEAVYFDQQRVFSPGSWLGSEVLFPD